MKQQTQKNPTSFNSSINVLKRSQPRQQTIVTVKKDRMPVKLPAIVKKTSPITPSSIPSVNIKKSSQCQIPSLTIINKPPPIPKILKPIVILPQHPSIKDHVTKANLTQKATLKCKSPRPVSAFSCATTFVMSESQEPFQSNHPLQNMNVSALLSESARKRLTRLFNKLDTDKDGHLSYPQVQKCIPSNLPHAQMTFFHVLYDIISDGTFFGLQEFFATAIIVEMIAKQDSMLWNTFLDDVDFNYYINNIRELLEDFNDQCSLNKGTINHEILLELIIKRTRTRKIERISNELEYIMPRIKTMKINRLEFIALLPAIIYIESCLEHGRTLFRFRDNSLLDTHMRQALLT